MPAGGVGPRRGKNRDSVLAEVADLYAQGKTPAQIARAQGVTVNQISYDLKIIRRYWRMSRIRDFTEAVARELANIDKLQETYWNAWARSLQPQEETMTERTDGETPRNVARVRREPKPIGSFEALRGVQWCIDRRVKLLGLDAPQHVTFEAIRAEAERIASVTGLQPEEIINEAESYLRALKRG